MQRINPATQVQRKLESTQAAWDRETREAWWRRFWRRHPEHQGVGHGLVETRQGPRDALTLVCACGEKWDLSGMEQAQFGFTRLT